MWQHTLALWRKSQQLERRPVAVLLTSCSDRLTWPAPDSRIGGPLPVARQPACRSQWCWPEEAFGQASSWLGRMQVRLAGSCMHKQGPCVTTKLFWWASVSIKTLDSLDSSKIEEMNSARECSRFYLPTLDSGPGKVWHFMLSSVSGCCILIDVLLLGYLCQSINRLDVAICSIQCHEQINNSIHLQVNHSNN